MVAASDERERLDEDEGEAVWEEGVGGEEEEAAVLEAAEQVRASQLLTDEQLGQLVRKTRSRTKAARTQAAPSAGASTSTARSECNEECECNEDSNSNSDSEGGGSKGIKEQRGLIGDSKLTCKQACN